MERQAISAGQSIRTLRHLAGLTLEEVARLADTSTAYLSKVETGKHSPTKSYVAQVTAAIAAEMSKAVA